jgi:hypothetical protein
VALKVLKSWLSILQHGAHCTIGDHNAGIQRVKQCARPFGQLDLLELVKQQRGISRQFVGDCAGLRLNNRITAIVRETKS